MNLLNEIAIQIELHSVEGIRDCFNRGLSPNALFKAEPLIYELTSEYTRSPRFKDCVRVFTEHGLEFEDSALLAVLLNDDIALEDLLSQDGEIVSRRYSLRCAYTPLFGVSLLHICAEFNHLACAKSLVQFGADINDHAGIDELGFGGQTPIFHTVNQNGNQSADMLSFLLERSADLDIAVAGLVWGKTYEWETLIPAVNPISYSMMGLLPQMHRDEETISETVRLLMKYRYGIDYELRNVPNAYLK